MSNHDPDTTEKQVDVAGGTDDHEAPARRSSKPSEEMGGAFDDRAGRGAEGASRNAPERADVGETPPEDEAAHRRSTKRGKSKSKKPRKKGSDKEIAAKLLERDRQIEDHAKKIAELQGEVNSLQDKRLRAVAEFENYRKRVRKEWELHRQQTKAEVLSELLEVVDNFERAFSMMGDREDDVVQGIRLIYNSLLGTLEKLGVSKMEVKNKPFDPKQHMAVAQIDDESVETNHVAEVVKEGYLLDDMVLRPAHVVIAK